MYCRLCDIEYPKSLRFCKWCGGGLVAKESVGSQHCPSCGSSVEREWLFCNECGVDLATLGAQPRDLACPSCSAPVRKGWMFCRQCGEQIATERAGLHCGECGAGVRESWHFCKQCGTELHPGEAQPKGGPLRTVAGMPALPPEPAEDAPFSNLNSGELPHLDDVIAQERPAAGAAAPPGVAPPLPGGTRPFSTSRSTGQLDDGALEREIQEQERETIPPGAATKVGRLEASELLSSPPPPTDATQALSSPVQPENGAISPRPAPPATTGPQLGSPHPSYPRAETPASPQPAAPQPSAPPQPAAPQPAPPQQHPSYPPPQASSGLVSTQAYSNPDPMEATLAFSGPGSEPIDATQVFASPGQQRTDAELYTATVKDVASPPRPQAPQPPQSYGSPLPPPPQLPYPVQQAAPTAQGAAAAAPAPSREAARPGSALKWVLLAAGLFLLLAVAAAVGIFWWQQRPTTETAEAPATAEPAAPAAPAPPPAAAPAPPEGMVFVPAGQLRLGTDDPGADAYSRPAHTVDVKPFFIDRTEVTNADYKAFVDATGHAPPSQGWTAGAPAPGTERLPVTFVSWRDAQEYAKWAGKRLPTEAEWEYAARGTDGRLYPWGPVWDPSKGNLGKETEAGRPVAVGSFPAGASPFGALDMVGNVWEWTASDFSLYPGSDGSLQKYDRFKVIRGGAYDNTGANTAVYRGFYPVTTALPRVGFRCAKDIP